MSAAAALFAAGCLVLVLLDVALKRAVEQVCRVANESHEEDE